MTFDFNTLEPQIWQILSAPGTDLKTISAKRVRRQLLEVEPSLTAEFLKDNKVEVDAVIASVFARVSADQDVGGSQDVDDEIVNGGSPRKRKQEEYEEEAGEDEIDDEEEEEESTPPPKKAKKAGKKSRAISDAELARQISSELNGRSRRSTGKGRGNANNSPKKGGRKKKSAAMIDSEGESDDEEEGKRKAKPKKKSGSGNAKGGFAKEYALSEPLAALLQVDKLSRPQVVKHLWDYIKGNELQNPSNKREIMCDGNLRAVFNVDKIDMFRMNKVLGQHLHENEG